MALRLRSSLICLHILFIFAVELDFSNTLWRGVLTENAFNTLTKLTYLDMGQNFYDFTNIDTIPSFIAILPNLKRLYVDRIRPTPNSPTTATSLSLDFIATMPGIIEMWMDYTNVRGPLPSNIGDSKSLRSLSCVYCKLTGNIPASIVNTNIDRLWLYGNPELVGGFPATFGSFNWRYLYLEDTGISEQIPQSICNQVGDDITTDLLELGADCDICPANCCTCCGEGCGNLEPPTIAPTGAPAPAGPVFCFSGLSMVQVQHRGLQKMSDLALGDVVKVAPNRFEPIYSFGHKNTDMIGQFLVLYTQGNHKLELSADHMVSVEGRRSIPASMIRKGDKLLTASGEFTTVKNIGSVRRKGVYAPFTESGTIVVNDIVASNYVAFQGAEYLEVAGTATPFSYQWLAHGFNCMHRIAYKMGYATSETYTDDGTSQWVARSHIVARWLLQQNSVVMIAFVAPAVVLVGLLSLFVEPLVSSPTLVYTCSLLLCSVLSLLAIQRSTALHLIKSKRI